MVQSLQRFPFLIQFGCYFKTIDLHPFYFDKIASWIPSAANESDMEI